MLTVLLVGLVLCALAAFAVVLMDYHDALKEWRAVRTVICPADHRDAQIRTNARHIALAAVTGRIPNLKIESCSRWPDRKDCLQHCLHQIEPGHIGVDSGEA